MDGVPLPTVPEAGPEGVPVGRAAELLGTTVDTIRYYEREGLTLTRPRRDPGGRRGYGTRDLAWLAGLAMLRGTGMTIQEIREYAAAYRAQTSVAERLGLLEAHRDRVVARLEETTRHLAALERKIDAYRAVSA
ncbi:MerR family transcriptional regulator [Streptomyces sp. NPDC047002]|uniref:MerR family transcriptional regulator n=1 Tax=Streptomyces sp. NPDC047002 TaxID=3155475 RepID=UPI00345715A4